MPGFRTICWNCVKTVFGHNIGYPLFLFLESYPLSPRNSLTPCWGNCRPSSQLTFAPPGQPGSSPPSSGSWWPKTRKRADWKFNIKKRDVQWKRTQLVVSTKTQVERWATYREGVGESESHQTYIQTWVWSPDGGSRCCEDNHGS